MRFDDDNEDIYEDDENELLKGFVLPPDISQKTMVLQILDEGGNIEDIIFDIEEIYKYVSDVYKKCPERN
jgi:hypothetical protein